MSTENGKTRTEIGRHCEAYAEHYLQQQGLSLLERNYRCRGGEIDLVMQDGTTLVFVEVRFRRHRAYGGALESVDWRKQQRLVHAAEHYLQRQGAGGMPCRFDVIAIAPGSERAPQLQWIQNAIELG